MIYFAIEFYNLVQIQTLTKQKIKELFDGVHTEVHNICKHHINNKEFNKTKENSKKKLNDKINQINHLISLLNKEIKEFKDIYDFKKVSRVKRNLVNFVNEYEIRGKNSSYDILKEYGDLKERVLKRGCRFKTEVDFGKMRVQLALEETIKDLEDINKKIDYKNMLFFKDQNDKDLVLLGYYWDYFKNIASLYGLGYEDLAVFLSGNLLEKLVTDYIILLIKKKKINLSIKRLHEIKFEDKINLIHNFILEKEYLRLKSIKIDRNILAHPHSKKVSIQTKRESETQIKSAFFVSKYLIRQIRQTP
jgi:hypothetical protein